MKSNKSDITPGDLVTLDRLAKGYNHNTKKHIGIVVSTEGPDNLKLADVFWNGPVLSPHFQIWLNKVK